MFEDTFDLTQVAEIIVGLATHQWFKIRDPVHLFKGAAVVAVVPSLPLLYLIYQQGGALSALSVPLLVKSYAICYIALTLSLFGYRLSPWHPLAKYPGPLHLCLNRFWPFWISYRGKYHLYVKELHDKYGPTVRVGPNDISSTEKDLIPDVLGHHNMPKGPMWDARRFLYQPGQEYDSIIDVRDSAIHAHLRKPWAKAFAAEPMNSYENMLIPRVNELNRCLRDVITKSGSKVGKVDLSHWINYFAYDFMGDIAFGGAFDLMRDGDPRGQHQTMGDGMYLMSIMHHLPWIYPLMRPFSRGMNAFVNLGLEKSMERVKKGMTKKDIFYYMTEAGGEEDVPIEVVVSNCLLAIVAGSDTSSSAMANAIYLLLQHPQKLRLLQKEIDEAYNTHQVPDLDIESDETQSYHDVLAGLKYLNAVINESLRLVPSIGTTLQRAPSKGSGGHMLTGGDSKLNIWLPEGNGCNIPPYVMQRDPRYFSPKPEEFIPERWIDTTGYNTNRDAFIPFSYGPTNCIGRPLGMMELRYVIATLVRNFNMEFDLSKGRPENWVTVQKDRFTMVNGELNINISLRTKEMRGMKH